MPYVVLTLPQGTTLAERLQATGPLSEREALQIIHQVGEILVPLHAAGLLHGDIQPQNLVWNAHTQQAVLTHLSWARFALLGEDVPNRHWFAPGYTALEQYLPGVTATPATDIYALAATLYTLLTGQTPIAANQRDRHPLPNPRQFRADLSPIVEQVILQGMEINPRLRPQDLAQWLALFPQRSRPAQSRSSRPLVLPPLGAGWPAQTPTAPIPTVQPTDRDPAGTCKAVSSEIVAAPEGGAQPEIGPVPKPGDRLVSGVEQSPGSDVPRSPALQTPASSLPHLLALPKLGRRPRPGTPKDAATPAQRPAPAARTSQAVPRQPAPPQPIPKYVDDGVVAVPVQSTMAKATVKSKPSKPRSQRAASPPSRPPGTPVSSNSSSAKSPAFGSSSRFPSNRRLFQGLLVASAAAAFFGGGFGLTLRFAGDRGPMNSRLLQPNQSFPPQTWPGEADAAQFDFSNLPARGESSRWEDPVTPAQPTWPLEEESAFPPPPVTRAPIAPEPALAPSETETGPTADVSPPAASPAVPAPPDFPASPALSPDASRSPSTPVAPVPESAPVPVDPPPAAVEPSLPPPAPSNAAGDVAPPPTLPMQESRTAHPEELS